MANTLRSKRRVFLLYSEITPYRLALFDEVARKVDLLVNFCLTKSKKRLWSPSTEGYSFKSSVLRYVNIGPLVINYLLPFRLMVEPYQVYIVDDDPRLILSKLITFLIAKLKRKPVIIWSEDIGAIYFGRLKNFIHTKIFSFVNAFVYANSNAFLASGHQTADFLKKKGLSDEKLFVGTQGLSAKQLKSKIRINKTETKALLQVSAKKVVLFVGYLVERKGIFDLVQAFKQLDPEDSVLIVAGGGAHERAVKELAGNQDSILFPGYVDGYGKAQYYSIADVFVLPTLADPWGLVIMEAMMFGLPVITTTAAGASELIRENGIVIEPGSQQALMEAIKYLLANDEIRAQMGRKSKEIINEYTVERAADTFMQAINSCLNGREQTKSLNRQK